MIKEKLVVFATTAILACNIVSLKAQDTPNSEEQPTSDAVKTRAIFDNQFNPSIGVVLNGKLTEFSAATSEFAGFGVEEEGERSREGIQIDESEINFSASVDDKFF